MRKAERGGMRMKGEMKEMKRLNSKVFHFSFFHQSFFSSFLSFFHHYSTRFLVRGGKVGGDLMKRKEGEGGRGGGRERGGERREQAEGDERERGG